MIKAIKILSKKFSQELGASKNQCLSMINFNKIPCNFESVAGSNMRFTFFRGTSEFPLFQFVTNPTSNHIRVSHNYCRHFLRLKLRVTEGHINSILIIRSRNQPEWKVRYSAYIPFVFPNKILVPCFLCASPSRKTMSWAEKKQRKIEKKPNFCQTPLCFNSVAQCCRQRCWMLGIESVGYFLKDSSPWKHVRCHGVTQNFVLAVIQSEANTKLSKKWLMRHKENRQNKKSNREFGRFFINHVTSMSVSGDLEQFNQSHFCSSKPFLTLFILMLFQQKIFLIFHAGMRIGTDNG